jgi:hypothetical protein
VLLLIEQKALETLDELITLRHVPPLALHVEQLRLDTLVALLSRGFLALVGAFQAGTDVIAKSLEHQLLRSLIPGPWPKAGLAHV